MKKIYLVIVFIAFSSFLFGQRASVSEIPLSTTFNTGAQLERAATDTLTSHFTGATPNVYSSGTSGYVAGHNDFEDIAFMQKFTSPSPGLVTDLLFWFYAKEGSPLSYIVATIWNDSSGVPGAVLDTAHIPFSAIDTATASYVPIPNAAYNTVATFSNPVPLPANNIFWAGFSVIYAPGDSVGLFTSTNGDFPNAATETFSQFSDSSFHSFNDGTANTWELDVALAVFPVLDLSINVNELQSNSAKLWQNQPNPAFKNTTIKYETTANTSVVLKVYNVAGKEVIYINEGIKPPGKHGLILNTADLPSGVYYYTLIVDRSPQTKKMIVVK